MQTLKFIKELGRFTDLQTAVILGGDSMDNQFSAIHGNPDVIVATPGRFMHICVEMELKLNSVEYVVFDEADRYVPMYLIRLFHFYGLVLVCLHTSQKILILLQFL